MILMVIYPIGFLLTLTFFKFFGESVGMGGYDPPHPDYYDDWKSNDEAFFGFSLGWFMVMPVLILVGLMKLLFLFSKWYINLNISKPNKELIVVDSKKHYRNNRIHQIDISSDFMYNWIKMHSGK